MKIKNKVCYKKTNKAAKKDMKNRINQNNDNCNIACKYLNIINFLLIID